jgi:hypothetical protein
MHVARIVGELEQRVVGGLGGAHVEPGPGLDAVAQAPVLGRGKQMARRQGKRLVVGVERLHRRPSRPAGVPARSRK